MISAACPSRDVRLSFLGILLSLCILFLPSCSSKPAVPVSPWLNHSDTAEYVGIGTCRTCHADKFETFIHTGMGSSFGPGTTGKSAADFSGHPILRDTFLDFNYYPFWKGDNLFIREFRLEGKDTVYKREQQADFIIGSGQHTNSHLYSKNGYVYQLPMTFYTQKGKWDFPPGFENGFNSRFSRKIGLECMSCHNAMPEDFVLGSENKFEKIPMGIDCERCHGPGSIHVNQKRAGILTDTSRFIDYSIVNPGKLSADRQFDVCQRCHLQGNAVLKEGKSFFDFRPGMKLSEVMSVFLPVYEGGEEEFIMASHADRLRQSRCFLSSQQSANHDTLRPAKGSLTCVTCHNPHVSVKVTGKETFNNACKNCHGDAGKKTCSAPEPVRKEKQDDCVVCHMPKSGSIDIPHVRVTDHFIRKPVNGTQTEKIRRFIRLACINDPAPDAAIRARAFLQQYERFEKKPFYLDSVAALLPKADADDPAWVFEARIHLLYLKNDADAIVANASYAGAKKIIEDYLPAVSFDNRNAWTAYRLGEAYYSTGKYYEAVKFFSHARMLSSYNAEFGNKLASALIMIGNLTDAAKVLDEIIREEENYVPALNNLGLLAQNQGRPAAALAYFQQALALDPDYEPLLLNLARYHHAQHHRNEALLFVMKVIRKNPSDPKAREILKEIRGY